MSFPRVDHAAAVGVVGLTIVQMHTIYKDSSPTLDELRQAQPKDPLYAQLLLDADLYVGGIALLVGAATSAMSRQIEPLLLAVAGFFLISLWHHAVLNSDQVKGANRK